MHRIGYMLLTNDQIAELVKEIAGKEAVPLVLEIKNKENVSEFKLADKLKKSVNEVRNYFYRLHEHEIVHFMRKKDKKKGWYVYYWTFDHRKAKNLLLGLKRKNIRELRDLIRQDSSAIFFICPKGCTRVNTENALEIGYRCTECNSLLNPDDVSKRIKETYERIKKLEQEMGLLSSEVVKEEEKRLKKAVKRLKVKKLKKKIKKVGKGAKKRK